WLPNLPEFYMAALGIAKLGAVFIPSSTQFREAEVAYRLQDSAAVAAITTAGLADAVECARGACPALRNVVVVGKDVQGAQVDCDRLIATGDESFVPAATRSDEPAFIAY